MYLLFDIGGTNTRIAFSEDGKSIVDKIIYPTPQDFKQAVTTFKKKARGVIKKRDFKVIAGGLPGTLDEEQGILLRSPNLKQWENISIKKIIAKETNRPVFLANDADLVGLGEAVYGAGKGYEVVFYLTISTGVGGVRILKKKISHGIYSSEPGWQYVHGLGLKSSRNKDYDALENFVSGTAVAKANDKPAAAITDERVWNKVSEILAYGLHNSMMHWSPDVIVLGGSMIKSLKCEKIYEYLKNISNIYPKLPEIKPAAMDNTGGLYGALVLAKQGLKKING